jgi:formylglycine-generating enzyme required for sulfatase activity
MRQSRILFVTLTSLCFLATDADAQSSFGSSCAGASGVTPAIAVTGVVESGQIWTLDVRAPGGIGLGYLLVGFSNTSASVFGGVPLPLDLGVLFGDPLWSGCPLSVDPSYWIRPYTFDPNVNGGLASFDFLGFDTGSVFVQALNVDADFVTGIAGVSRGVEVVGSAQLAPGMVAIPAGTFQMGSNAPSGAPYFGTAFHQPVHSVTISTSFWIGRTEVNQAEYQGLMGSNPSTVLGPDLPVYGVTWDEARAYCAALTALEDAAGNVPPGFEYRLPTEAEWEYACRAGSTTEYAVGSGSELFCADANTRGASHLGQFCPSIAPVAVSGYAPNAWGLFDMHGNAEEWCLDASAAYTAGAVTDPYVTVTPWVPGDPILQRIVRGGRWISSSPACRSAYRNDYTPTTPGPSFRVVLAPALAPFL